MNLITFDGLGLPWITADKSAAIDSLPSKKRKNFTIKPRRLIEQAW
jgi:hypothetical protein